MIAVVAAVPLPPMFCACVDDPVAMALPVPEAAAEAAAAVVEGEAVVAGEVVVAEPGVVVVAAAVVEGEAVVVVAEPGFAVVVGTADVVVVATWHLQHACVEGMPAKGPALFWFFLASAQMSPFQWLTAPQVLSKTSTNPGKSTPLRQPACGPSVVVEGEAVVFGEVVVSLAVVVVLAAGAPVVDGPTAGAPVVVLAPGVPVVVLAPGAPVVVLAPGAPVVDGLDVVEGLAVVVVEGLAVVEDEVVLVVGTTVDVVLVVGTAVVEGLAVVDVVLVVGTAVVEGLAVVDVVLVVGAAVVGGLAVVDVVLVVGAAVVGGLAVVAGTAGVVPAVAPPPLAVQTIDGFDHCIARSGVGQPRLPSHVHVLAPSPASPPPPCALVNPAAHTYLAFAPDGCFLDASAIEASWRVTPVPAVCGAWPHMSWGASAFLILKSTCPAYKNSLHAPP